MAYALGVKSKDKGTTFSLAFLYIYGRKDRGEVRLCRMTADLRSG